MAVTQKTADENETGAAKPAATRTAAGDSGEWNRTAEGAPLPRFMTVKQVAAYLHVNEKKVYALVRDNKIPATKLTGKWLFPRDLVDQWLLESSHGGLLTDRIVIAGSDDPLLSRVIGRIANTLQSQALISYVATGTQLGLALLARRRADLCAIHWGPAAESQRRHPALIRQFDRRGDWALVRLFRREQGLVVSPGVWSARGGIEAFFRRDVRWVERQEGAGSQRFLQEMIARHDLDPSDRRITGRAGTEREAASLIAMGQADVGAGVRAAAAEFGLDFVSIGWEAFDLALHRSIYFRNLFQQLLESLRGSDCRREAEMLGGYDLAETGTLVWTGND
ncbi:MAG: helix-turn-helix transcriptional regulator [Gammaproteobacteria bacterium]|jgi:putative molybdopterin biosynthesis protein